MLRGIKQLISLFTRSDCSLYYIHVRGSLPHECLLVYSLPVIQAVRAARVSGGCKLRYMHTACDAMRPNRIESNTVEQWQSKGECDSTTRSCSP